MRPLLLVKSYRYGCSFLKIALMVIMASARTFSWRSRAIFEGLIACPFWFVSGTSVFDCTKGVMAHTIIIT